MSTMFIRAIILYTVNVVVIRLMGKRQIGQLQPFEFVITIMIADLASSPMSDLGIPILYGIMPILALLFMHSFFTVCILKSQKVRQILSGHSMHLIKNGKIDFSLLKRISLSMTDLLEAIRSSGYASVADVESAVLETNGLMSVFPKSSKRPVHTEDININPGYEGIPLVLVMDGVVQQSNLNTGGLDQNWLESKLKPLGFDDLNYVLLCSLDTQGMMYVHGKNEYDGVHLIKALDEQAVRW